MNTLLKFHIPLLFCIITSLSHADTRLDPQTIDLINVNGKSVNLKQLSSGKPIYLKFWATWCKDCITQMAHFKHIHEQYGDNIAVVGINVWINESLAAVKKAQADHELSMPILLDHQGRLAETLKLKGTPLHVLIDSKGRIVHKGFAADDDIDQKIAILSSGKLAPIVEKNRDVAIESNIKVPQKGVHAMIFTAAFCDWYLEESRPLMAENCAKAAHFTKHATSSSNNMEWQLVISHLWTGESDVASFKSKFGLDIASFIDENNKTFIQHNVNEFPTLVVFKNGAEVGRTSDFINPNAAEDLLTRAQRVQPRHAKYK